MFRKPFPPVETAMPPDEDAVLADIRHFEARIAALAETGSARTAASVQVYRLLLRQRRQLLAAIRDGVPERWPEYAARVPRSEE